MVAKHEQKLPSSLPLQESDSERLSDVGVYGREQYPEPIAAYGQRKHSWAECVTDVRLMYRSLGVAGLRAARQLVPPRYVVIHGFYGGGNVGDEAILAASLEQIRSTTDLQPVVFCKEPERVTADFGVQSVNPAQVGRRGVAKILLRTEVYLLGGGGLLKDYGKEGTSSMEQGWLRWLSLAQDIGVKTMLWSVGVENVRFDSSKKALRDVLAKTDVVAVRDDYSKARLQEIGIDRPIIVTADPVPYLARKYARLRSRPARPRVVACMRHWYPFEFRIPDEEINERMMGAVASTLDYLVEKHGAEVAFLPFRTSAQDDDRVACRAIQQRMRSEATLYDESDPKVEKTMERLAAADLVLGMRLHASVMATAMGIPSVAIAYMPKVRDYMASIGQSAMCADIDEVSGEGLIALAEDALGRYEAYSSNLLATTARSAARFGRNRELLADLLGGAR